MADILVVDDDRSIATAFEHFLAYENHEFRVASSAAEGLQALEQRKPDLVLMDVRMPGMDGIAALQEMRRRYPGLYVVIMTAYGTSQTSIDAIRGGAFDFIAKPLDLDELRAVIARAQAAQQGGRVGPEEDEVVHDAPTLVGRTAAMLDIYKLIGRLASTRAPALVVGEPGTGKRLIAATIHDNSDDKGQMLLQTPCGTTSDAELQAALFGGGTGTVVLTDVHLLSSPMQPKLAAGLAAARELVVSGPQLAARVVATTDRDLPAVVRDGRFMRELFEELSVVTITVPPLRERREDVPLLIDYFIRRFNAALNRGIRGVEDQVARLLAAHAWPGNVGELERVIKRAAIVAHGDVITVADIGNSLTDGQFPRGREVESSLERAVRAALHERLVQASGPAPYHAIVDAVETTLVREALTITNGNQVKASEILGVNRATLRKKMPTD